MSSTRITAEVREMLGGRLYQRKPTKFKPSAFLEGSQSPTSKLTEAQVSEIRRLYAEGRAVYSKAALGKLFGVSYITIKRIVTRKSWTSVR